MTYRGATFILAALALAGASLPGCSGSDDNSPPPPTGPTNTPASAPTNTPKPTTTALPTATRTPQPATGPIVTFFGLTRSDGTLLDPTTTTSDGVPIYMRNSGSGFALIVEGAPGPSGLAVGMSSYQSDLSTFPDLQIEVSRALGNGSGAVCDVARPTPGSTPGPGGGVPAISPSSFEATQSNINTVNDLACRFRDGVGNPVGVPRSEACVLFPSGEYDFVMANSQIQFCGFITPIERFPDGDTVVTVRLRDDGGNVGAPALLIVRVVPEPTPPPFPTPTATETPSTFGGPAITFFGVTRADNTLVEPTESTADGIPVYTRTSDSGFSLVVEGRPGSDGAPVSPSAYQSDLITFPDLQIQVSRPLGNGSVAVCDIAQAQPGATPVPGGGVPAIDPPSFALTESTIDAVNDLACRFRDGSGNPIGRGPNEGCVQFTSGEYGFVNPQSTTQFCGFVDGAIAFPGGETLVTARLRDTDGMVGAPRQLIIRVVQQP